MDERLVAGRHHLNNGEEAVRQGYPDDARMYFEAALLQFRGPELRLGEAHALRGLAQVAMLGGEAGVAERHAREAVEGYRELVRQLQRIDDTEASAEVIRQARLGEAAVLVLLGEILVRRGARDDARTALSHARVLGAKLGHFESVAGVFNTLARLAMREGRFDEARESMERALSTYQEAGSRRGQITTLLLVAELERLRGRPDAALDALRSAKPLATALDNPLFVGRVEAGFGALALASGREEDARLRYHDALVNARAAGDQEMEGYCLLGLGELASRSGGDGAVSFLLDGAQLFAELEHLAGLGAAMSRISEHALSVDAFELALVAAEVARRAYERGGAVQGVGQSGRLLLKALVGLKQWHAVLLVAAWRVDVVGAAQPKAAEVYAFYRKRAPSEWGQRIDAMPADRRARGASKSVLQAAGPILDRRGVGPLVFDDPVSAVDLVNALAAELPEASDLGYTEDATEVDMGPIPDYELVHEVDAVLVDDSDQGEFA